MCRRTFLSACALAGAGAVTSAIWARAEDGGVLDRRDVDVGGDSALARRARVLWPRGVKPGEKLPVLVLLHGLGETTSERLGLSAWSERYGLAQAYDRLLHPPVVRAVPGTSHWTKQRLAALNAQLAARPMGKLILVCPTTPNVYRARPTATALDRYADWLETKLLPAVRAQFPVEDGPSGTAIDGCSLGGYIALEVLIRKPAVFGSFGVVQAAIGEARTDEYARRLETVLARDGPKPIHLLTSEWDPYRRAQELLSKKLTASRIANELEVLPGGHDQIFLREIGTLTMLLWHDRQFRRMHSQRARGS